MILTEKINTILYTFRQYLKAFLLLPLLLLLLWSSNKHTPYPTGDGPEYILTTEALYNHNSADIQPVDMTSFKENSLKHAIPGSASKLDFFDKIEAFIKISDTLPFMDTFYASYYVDKGGKVYSHHFMFYSLVNVPMRYIMQWTNNEPMLGFEYTNILLILLTSSLLLFYNKDELWGPVALTLIFFFNAVFWYVNWIHTEALTACLVSASLFLFFQKRTYLSVFIMSLAALQNQPLAILVFMMVAYTLYIHKFTLRSIVLTGLSSVIVLWPSLFYYAHYNITSLISIGGYLSRDVITPEKFIGFFFDLNQGAILAIPIILPAYILVLIAVIVKSIKNKKDELSLFIPVALLIITYIVCMIMNWVHGMAVINRYACWISAIITIHFYYLFIGLQIKSSIKVSLLIVIIFSQIASVLYFEKDNLYDWMGNVHKAPAKWMINHFPSFYNPDPNIFIIRTTHIFNMDPGISPVLFLNDSQEIIKLAIHKDKLDKLKELGVSDAQIEKIKNENRFIIGWTYLNEDFFADLNPFYSIKVKKDAQEFAIQEKIHSIKSDSAWLEAVRQKAIEWNMPLDTVLRIDAKYLLEIK